MSSAELRENRTLERSASDDGRKGGTSDCADEVTLSRKGANGPARGRKLRSTGTKAKARVSNEPYSLVELKMQLEERTRELAEAREQQAETAEILRIISTSPTELPSVLEVVARSAARFCRADDVTIFELHGQELCATAHWGPIPQAIGLRLPCVRGHVAARTILERKPVHVLDLQAEAEEFPEGSAFAKRFGHRTTLAVPLLRQEAAVGTIMLRRAVVDPFTDKQIALLKTFAAQAIIAIENTRLLNELRESLQQQTATSEVLGVISSSPGELQPVFETMLASATRICEANFGNLYLRDGEVFRLAAAHNTPPALVEARRRTPLRPDSIVGRTQTTEQLVHVTDLAAEQAYAERDPQTVAAVELGGIRTLLVVPMIKESELIGLLTIYRQVVRPFSNKQIELLRSFAAQAVIAIENTRLLNELRQRTDDLSEALEQQTATSEVLRVISSSPGDLEPVFNTMLANATRICEAKFGVLFLSEGDGFRPVTLHGAPPEYDAYWSRESVFHPNPKIPLGRVARTKQVVHVADIRTEESYIERDPAFVALAELARARTLLVVPMLKENELVGAIAIYRQEVRPFTDKQIELVKSFASQAVIAIENVRLLNELRTRTDELGQSVEELRALGEVTQAVNSTLDLQTVLSTIVAKAVQLSDTDAGSIYVHDEAQQEFQLQANYGMSDDLIAALREHHTDIS